MFRGACLQRNKSLINHRSMDLQTWLIVGAVAIVGIIILHTVFSFLGSFLRWGITIAILVFLFGWGAVAAVPGKIYNAVTGIGKQSIDLKINGQAAQCTIIPSVEEGKIIVTKLKPTLDAITGPFGKDVTLTIIENKSCPGKAALVIRSTSIETLNNLKSSIQKIIPNIPVETDLQSI